MRNSSKNNKRSVALLLVKVFILTLFVSSLLKAAVGEATVVRSETQSTLLLQEIKQMHYNNEKLKSENENLQNRIKKNQMSYNETSYRAKIANTKIAYLTFDDGPSNNTLGILKILKQYDIKATFFLNGNPDLKDMYKQISEDGHALANHTYSHDYKTIYASAYNFKKDVKKLDDFITEITGKQPNHILRYPGGSNNNISINYGGKEIMNTVIKEMNEEGYTYFDWNVDSSDASKYRQSKNNIVKAVLNQSSVIKHPIILMHDLDQKTTTVQALPEIIVALKNRGYKFDVLSNNTYAPQFVVAK